MFEMVVFSFLVVKLSILRYFWLLGFVLIILFSVSRLVMEVWMLWEVMKENF